MTTPQCCYHPMKKYRDTLTKSHRFKCTICGAEVYISTVKDTDTQLDARYIASLKYQYKALLAIPDEQLTLQKRHRKQAVQSILDRWGSIKKESKKRKD